MSEQNQRADGADYDLAIIGSGPGGYVAAIRAAQLGLKVAIVEKGHLGGTCLNVGCIPTKAMLSSAAALHTARSGKEFGFKTGKVEPDYEAMKSRRDKIVTQLRGGIGALMKANKITVHQGLGSFQSAHEISVTSAEGKSSRFTAANSIIATGSVCASPPIPGSDLPGVVNSDQLLQLERVPASMAVIGAGAVGLEWADIFSELGTGITVLELMDRIVPTADADISKELHAALKKKNFNFQLGVKVQQIEQHDRGLRVKFSRGESVEEVEAEVVLVATGRWPFTEGAGLERLGVQLDRRFIPVDSRQRTSAAGIYAIGDVTPVPMLAHVASKGGEIAAEVIAGHDVEFDSRVIPSCIYTQPEAAWVGLTEEEARRQRGEVRTGTYSFRALGRAMAAGHRDGLVKVVAEPKYGEILGVHMVGYHVTDLIQQAAQVMAMEGTVDEVFHCIHAHPTLPEAFLEATLDAWDRAIHKV